MAGRWRTGRAGRREQRAKGPGVVSLSAGAHRGVVAGAPSVEVLGCDRMSLVVSTKASTLNGPAGGDPVHERRQEAPQHGMRLPYVGINVDRLPALVASAISRPSWDRSDLYVRWADRFGVSTKTAKEYVSSLANLGVLRRVGRQAVQSAVEEQTEEFALLTQFHEDRDWAALFTFVCQRVPAMELLRAVYLRHQAEYEYMLQGDIVAGLRRELAGVGVAGTDRSKSLETFLRLLGRTTASGVSPHYLRPPPPAVDETSLPPRLQAAVRSLQNDDRLLLDGLLRSCHQLAKTRRIYKRTGVFSIGDILAETNETASPNDWAKRVRRLRDRNLIALHRTIPSAAKQLHLTTIRDGSGVASAISFPRRLWAASNGLV